MPINRVVVNASPLICLFKSGLADLLPALFTEVIVPEEVWHEILAQGIRSAADLENSRKGYVNELMDLLREHQEFHQSTGPHGGQLKIPVGRMVGFPHISRKDYLDRGLHQVIAMERTLLAEDLEPAGFSH